MFIDNGVPGHPFYEKKTIFEKGTISVNRNIYKIHYNYLFATNE